MTALKINKDTIDEAYRLHETVVRTAAAAITFLRNDIARRQAEIVELDTEHKRSFNDILQACNASLIMAAAELQRMQDTLKNDK